jgi:hypothetical protein
MCGDGGAMRGKSSQMCRSRSEMCSYGVGSQVRGEGSQVCCEGGEVCGYRRQMRRGVEPACKK